MNNYIKALYAMIFITSLAGLIILWILSDKFFSSGDAEATMVKSFLIEITVLLAVLFLNCILVIIHIIKKNIVNRSIFFIFNIPFVLLFSIGTFSPIAYVISSMMESCFSADEKIKTFIIISLSWLTCLTLFWVLLKLCFKNTKSHGNVIR